MTTTPPVMSGPDVKTALAWRDWESGLAEAGRRAVPVLALAEAPWTSSAQRLGLILSQDEALRAELERHVVPIFVDPGERPDLVSRWRAASVALTGTCGPPLLMLLTHEGQPLLSYCTMWPEGREPFPSLRALVQALGDTYARDPDAFLAEARALDAGPASEQHSWRSPREWLQRVSAEIDPRYGGMREIPKHPNPQLLWFLLDLYETGHAPEAGEWVQTALRAMRRGGIYDQLGDDFHRCSREERWIVPHFEKPVPLNAQLAAVYARAAQFFHDDEWRSVATRLSAFCLGMVRQGFDVVAADTHYYTWTSREFLEVLSPTLLQAVSLHYNLVPDNSRQVLYLARDVPAIQKYSAEDAATLHDRLQAGREHLRAARAGRVQPASLPLSSLSWSAESFRWLFSAAHYGVELPLGELFGGLDALASNEWDRDDGFMRSHKDGVPRAWLEDQASLLSASIAAYRASGDDRWLTRARDLAEVIRGRYRGDGFWLDAPVGMDDGKPSMAIIDDVIPATIATLIEGFDELSRTCGDQAYARIARDSAPASLISTAATCPHRSSAFWRAWFRSNQAATDLQLQALSRDAGAAVARS